MMTLDPDGNYLPWIQPEYGTDAQDKPVIPPVGYSIVRPGVIIQKGWQVFDVYAGWIKPDNYSAENKYHTRTKGRWTTWAQPI
jgi:hypothetical protein